MSSRGTGGALLVPEPLLPGDDRPLTPGAVGAATGCGLMTAPHATAVEEAR